MKILIASISLFVAGMTARMTCYMVYSPCMTMMDGSTGYCEEEECSVRPVWYPYK